MANLTANYVYERKGQELLPIYRELQGIAGVTYYTGGLVYMTPAANSVTRIPSASAASPAPQLEAIGWTTANAYLVPSSNALALPVHSGVWRPKLNSTAAAVSATHLWKKVYAENDHTVRSDNGGGIYPVAGILWGLELGTGFPLVLVGLPLSAILGSVSPDSAFKARGVVYSNIADLTAFTVASDDGITYVEGDVILAALQTTAAQCGPYVVGVVAAGVAPLSRPAWWRTGDAIPLEQTIEIRAGGTHYGSSTWKPTRATAGVIGTDDPVFYPKSYNQTVTLASGTYTIGLGSTATPDEPLFLLSATKSDVSITQGPAGTVHVDTIRFRAAVTTVGKAGTALIEVRADVAAGTINASDASILKVGVTNW